MPVDPGFCEDLAGRLDGPLTVLEDRLNGDDAPVIHPFADASHDALALKEIARARAHRQIGIAVREHAGVLAPAGPAGVRARANQAPPASEVVREVAAHR